MIRILAAVLAAFLSVPEAHSQAMCTRYEYLIDTITAPEFGERKIAEGQTPMGAEGSKVRMEVFAAPLGRTYTIILVRPDGVACVIGGGSNLKTYPLPVEGQDL